MIKLYHGSTLDIRKIDLTKSRPNKDFGKGFFFLLTSNKHGAWENSKH